MAKTLKTITVKQLVVLLLDQNPDARVIFSTNYGDHACTQQVHAIHGEFEDVSISTSAYSDSGFALDNELDIEAHDDEPFVLIK